LDAKIEELVKNGINESEIHDFKSGLPPAIQLTVGLNKIVTAFIK